MKSILAIFAAFVGTNLDDILINALLFSSVNTKREIHAVVLGKYIGIGTLAAISLLGGSLVGRMPDRYLSYLGLVPIFLGLGELLSYWHGKNHPSTQEQAVPGRKMLSFTILITLSNGADNIGVYVPLFAGFSRFDIYLTAGIFAVMTGVWCVLGKKISDLPVLHRFLSRYGGIVVPVVFIILGIYILLV